MQAGQATLGFSPSLDVLPDLTRSRPVSRDLVLPLLLLLEFLVGVLASTVG